MPRLHSLTGLRFIAAALVLGHHAALFFLYDTTAWTLFRTGFVGVGFFFALSGFVLTWTWRPELSARHFYGRRVARLMPLHWSTAAIAPLVIVGLIGGSIALAPAVANVFLLQSWVPSESYTNSLNGVSWSLSCEAFFYLCFPVLVVRAERWNPIRAAVVILALIVVAAAAIVALLPHDIAHEVTYKNPAYRMGGFALGVVLAWAVKRGWRLRLSLNAVLAVAAGGYILASAAPRVAARVGGPVFERGEGDLVFLPFALLLIAAAASVDLGGAGSWLGSRTMVLLGEASFALYMTHYLILQSWTEVFDPPASTLGATTVAVLVSATCVGFSVIAYKALERPAEASLRRRLGTPATSKSGPSRAG